VNAVVPETMYKQTTRASGIDKNKKRRKMTANPLVEAPQNFGDYWVFEATDAQARGQTRRGILRKEFFTSRGLPPMSVKKKHERSWGNR